MEKLFRKFARKVSNTVGSPYIFLLALILVIVWLATGPLFEYSDTWQLAINTFTTIITFLMVFLIQNTQNRDAKTMSIKIDELIKSVYSARNKMIDLDELTDQELAALEAKFIELAHKRQISANHKKHKN